MLDYDIKAFKVPQPFKINNFYTMFSRNYEGGYIFPGEAHDFWEFTYVREGALCKCIDGKVYNVEKGDLIFYKPMEFHQFHVEKDENLFAFFFSFSFESFPKDFAADTVYKLNGIQRKIMQKLIDLSEDAVNNYPFTNEEIAVQKAEYVNFEFVKPLLALSKRDTDIATVLNCVYELFLSLYDTGNVVEATDSLYSDIYKKAVDYMNGNISEKITITDISKHCCISETTLKKVFYHFSGSSIHRYFIQLKIIYASKLLKSGVSASETARCIGFASQAYFSAAFKRETGLSPSEYSRRYTD